jgi:hypothetical protein
MKNMFLLVSLLSLLFGCKKENPVEQHDEQIIRIQYEHGFKDELNTFEGFVQKDLVKDGTTKVPLWLSAEEQESIITVVEETHYFSLPDTIHREPNVFIQPDFSPDKLRIQYKNEEKIVVWYYPMQLGSPYRNSLNKIISRIDSVLSANNTYKQLPPQNGGYD